MAEKRQKKQAVKAFEKETFSKDKEVTGAKHTEHRQDNTFPTENHFHANEKPVSNLPRDANHGSDTKNVTSGHNVQKSEADAEKAFLKENSFMQEEQPGDSDSTMENEVHVRDTYQRSEEKGKYHKGRVQREDTAEQSTENTTENSTEGTTEETQPSAKCTCKEKCSQYAVDEDCEVCAKDYKECAYINPSVKITINTPSGWHNDTTKVTVKVEDTIV